MKMERPNNYVLYHATNTIGIFTDKTDQNITVNTQFSRLT